MIEERIFKKGSTTYYWSSKFFPASARQDVFDLYTFVRVADDYVDQVPADSEGFYRLRRMLIEARETVTFSTSKHDDDTVDQRAIKNIVRLQQDYDFEWSWIEAFLDVMQSDLTHKTYKTLDDSLGYVYGSAEVIGLMMARIMGLPKEADHAARMQGRAMQWINFIRDIAEDNQLKRQYFPIEDLESFGLADVSEAEATAHPEAFRKFIEFQLDRYQVWQTEAEAGYQYIPKRLLIPLKTASDMYSWTGKRIYGGPLIVFRKKLKPKKTRVLFTILKNVV